MDKRNKQASLGRWFESGSKEDFFPLFHIFLGAGVALILILNVLVFYKRRRLKALNYICSLLDQIALTAIYHSVQ